MSTKLTQKSKNNFEKDFLNLMNNKIKKKNMENASKYRDIKLETIENRRNYLVSEPNYHTKKIFYRKFISNRNEKDSNINE